MRKLNIAIIATASAMAAALSGLSSAQAVNREAIVYGDVHNNTDRTLHLVSLDGSTPLSRLANDYSIPVQLRPGQRGSFKSSVYWSSEKKEFIYPTVAFVYSVEGTNIALGAKVTVKGEMDPIEYFQKDGGGKRNTMWVNSYFDGRSNQFPPYYDFTFRWQRNDNGNNPGPLFEFYNKPPAQTPNQ